MGKERSIKHILNGMVTLATGVSGSKLISLASLPVITRLYTPADVGLLSLFAAFVMMAGPLLTLQYEWALPLPKRASVAMNLLVLTALLVACLLLIMIVVLAFNSTELLGLLSMEELTPFWWVLPIGAGMYAVYRMMQMWATRERRYRVMSTAELLQSAAGNATKIVFGLTVASPLGLLVGHIIALSGGAFRLLLHFSAGLRILRRHVSLRRIRAVANRYSTFPKFRLPSQLALIMATNALVFFIGANYGTAEAGQFGLAMMALTMPVNLIARTMANAYYGEIANLGAGAVAQIRASVFSVAKLYGLVGIVLSLSIYFLAPLLFPFVFGDSWIAAGQYAAILSLYLTFQFIAVPVMNVLSVFNREDANLHLNAQRLVLVAAVLGAAIYFELSIQQTLFNYSMVMALHYMFSVYKVFSVIPKASVKE